MKMKRLGATRILKQLDRVQFDGDKYERREYFDGTFSWCSLSYDGECDDKLLEEQFQSMLKGEKDVESKGVNAKGRNSHRKTTRGRDGI